MRTTWWTLAVVIAGGVSGCGDGGGSAGSAQEDLKATASTAVPAEELLLPCAKSAQRALMLDIPGPGRPTPQEAVAPYAEGMSTIVVEASNRTVVYALGAKDQPAKVFQLTKHDDGWWPDGYVECRD